MKSKTTPKWIRRFTENKFFYIFIGVVAVLSIVFVIVFSDNQEFNITKKECVNKTITENIALPLHLFSYFDRENPPTESELISVCLNINGTIHEDERWEDKKWDFTLYCMIEDFTHEKEVCEDVEVEKIDYDCVEKITTTTDSVCPDCVIWKDDKKNPYVDWIVNNESQILKREVICRKELSKKDLNVDWLSDNCKCIRCKSEENLQFCMKDGEDIIGCRCADCQKYKCKDYQIEVLK